MTRFYTYSGLEKNGGFSASWHLEPDAGRMIQAARPAEDPDGSGQRLVRRDGHEEVGAAALLRAGVLFQAGIKTERVLKRRRNGSNIRFDMASEPFLPRPTRNLSTGAANDKDSRK